MIQRLAYTTLLAVWAGTPATAWEFTAAPICTLTHTAPDIRVTVTYDVSIPEYAITLSNSTPWPDAATFALRFDGPAALTIGTDKHRRDNQNRSVTVTDRGFGNVLDGLQFNDSMTALLGDTAVTVSLDGAAGSVADFRSCPAPVIS